MGKIFKNHKNPEIHLLEHQMIESFSEIVVEHLSFCAFSRFITRVRHWDRTLEYSENLTKISCDTKKYEAEFISVKCAVGKTWKRKRRREGHYENEHMSNEASTAADGREGSDQQDNQKGYSEFKLKAKQIASNSNSEVAESLNL
ncbi:hypothetical protein AB6A40_004125 [Gnathostoma spinigerum]|uniref:Uncharacterized protein n=1 Tax=Gnathostoma spinigerum TaxID=75299 RepID=A0ABD6EDW8_9BILA